MYLFILYDLIEINVSKISDGPNVLNISIDTVSTINDNLPDILNDENISIISVAANISNAAS
jgi:hypothetical protein